MAGDVVVRREGPVAVLTIDHPPANALSRDVVAALEHTIAEAAADPDVRALVITGAGDRYFVAGADLKELRAPDDATRSWMAVGQGLMARMARLRLPIVAALNGFALGGGLELAMACDIRVAAATAQLGQPEVNRGLMPGWGGTQRLPRLIGRGAALALLLTGETIGAEAARGLGLVHEVTAAGGAVEGGLAWAQRLAAQAPVAVAQIKRAVADGLDRPIAEGLQVELDGFMTCAASQDAREGVAAFLAKRPPTWSGR